jgi:hypothetical protein
MHDKPSISSETIRAWFEPVAVVIMALASLSSAWCTYQSSRWSGVGNARDAQADKLSREAFGMHLEAQQVESMQVRLAMAAVNAHMQADEKVEHFYTARFAGELKPAWDKWIALKPFDNPQAPPHPFVPALYTPRFEQEIRDARKEAAIENEQSTTAGHHAGSYLRNTVVLATVLFFAGTAGKFEQLRVRRSSLAFAIALFLYVAVQVLMLPVA